MRNELIQRDFAAIPVSDAALRWLAKLQSGSATAEDKAELAAWRAADPEHEAAFQEAEDLWDLGSALGYDTLSGFVQPAAPVRPRQPTKHGSRAISSRLAIAASVALAVCVGAWGAVDREAVLADYAAGVGEARHVTLADDSVVSLNADASMDVVMDDTHRRVVLRSGKAFFQVTRDSAGRPFEVEAGGVTVTVRGTAFEVDRRSDHSVAVTVSEHAVAVKSPAAEPVIVKEGERLMIDAQGTPGTIAAANPARVAAWREGRLIADAQPLSEVVDMISHYHRGWIVVDDASIETLAVNAVLDLADPIESLRTLSAALPIRVRAITPYLIVISRA